MSVAKVWSRPLARTGIVVAALVVCGLLVSACSEAPKSKAPAPQPTSSEEKASPPPARDAEKMRSPTAIGVRPMNAAVAAAAIALERRPDLSFLLYGDRSAIELTPDQTERLRGALNRATGKDVDIVGVSLGQVGHRVGRVVVEVDEPEPDATHVGPAEAFGVLMCVSFDRTGPGMVTLASALSDKEQDPARSLGNQRFEFFIAQVGRRLAGGQNIVGEVLERIVSNDPDLFAADLDETQMMPKTRPPRGEAPAPDLNCHASPAPGASIWPGDLMCAW